MQYGCGRLGPRLQKRETKTGRQKRDGKAKSPHRASHPHRENDTLPELGQCGTAFRLGPESEKQVFWGVDRNNRMGKKNVKVPSEAIG